MGQEKVYPLSQAVFHSRLQCQHLKAHRYWSVSAPQVPRIFEDKADRMTDSESSSSNLTSSDKLSALPGIHSSPALDRLRQATRPARRSLDAPGSLPSIESASPGLNNLSRFPSRTSGSDGSAVGRETPRQRVSFEGDRGSLPATFQNIRQGASAPCPQRPA